MEAVEITADNIEEAAKSIGELRYNAENDPFIVVDNRIVSNVERVFIGFWMTRYNRRIHCYSRRSFYMQFIAEDENTIAWLEYIEKHSAIPARPREHVDNGESETPAAAVVE